MAHYSIRGRMRPNIVVKRDWLAAGFPHFLPAHHLRVNATERRITLRQCDLGAELPLVAVLRPSVSDSKQKYTTDRYQRGGLHRSA